MSRTPAAEPSAFASSKLGTVSAVNWVGMHAGGGKSAMSCSGQAFLRLC